jgi:pyruvate dehydrogenase E2 component (dihydrolipoamide acetyltransferase)
MAEMLQMLALSPTMETGTIVKWNRAEGDTFSSGDVLCEVETDKATMEYEAASDGTLRKITAPAGSKVRVGDLIAINATADEDISELLASAPATAQEGAVESAETAAPDVAADMIAVAAQGENSHLPDGVRASPLARKIARERGINLRTIQGSGPGGRIVKADLGRSSAAKPVRRLPAAVEAIDTVVPLSDKRRIIAARLSESKLASPHFYLTVKVAADGLVSVRSEINKTTEPRLSFNAFLVKLVAAALSRHPQVNASWTDDAIIRHGSVDIALAVAQPDGLVTPVVRGAQRKGIIEIDTELRDLISRAREGKLSPEEYSDSTFTISNLGSYGVHQFAAIINPPNAAILSIGEIFREPYEAAGNTVAFRSAMFLTLSCDHRIIDGAAAGEFARDLKNMIERPISALL